MILATQAGVLGGSAGLLVGSRCCKQVVPHFGWLSVSGGAPSFRTGPSPSRPGPACGRLTQDTWEPGPGAACPWLPPASDRRCRETLQDHGSVNIKEGTITWELGELSVRPACLSCACPSVDRGERLPAPLGLDGPQSLALGGALTGRGDRCHPLAEDRLGREQLRAF